MKHSKKILVFIIACITLFFSGYVFAYDLKPVILNPDYKHDRFNTQPKDIARFFRAYTVSFDGADDNNNDGTADKWGIPEWVAYELHRTPQGLAKGPKRPSRWITDKSLHNTGVAPDDDSYKHSGYSRGHMCMKSHAWRLGENADWNTHTVLNACPQLQKLNGGSWLALEFKTGKWADLYGKVWVICGPVVNNLTPTEWIGDSGEIKAVVPDAFFKIVVKESGEAFDILAFLFPKNDEAGRKVNLEQYLTSVDNIEQLTGIDFLTSLADSIEENLEGKTASELWDGS
jgi:endonuclease G, mitochondrial